MAAVCSSSVPRGPDGSAGEGGWLSGMMFALSVLRSYVMPCGRGDLTSERICQNRR